MANEDISNSIHGLVAALPEIYQPIFGHPALSSAVSRGCGDRLTHITQTYQALETQLNRPLRVLDLGCAQGYFSLSLAKLCATVHGVDFLDANIAVCQALAGEYPELKISFQMGRIEDVLAQLAPDQYDLILGLSVFHHIVHEAGSASVQQMLAELAGKVTTGIFELALASEPLYWASSQPENPRQLLEGFSFVHELAQHGTHLSDITRPLYVASNRYWCLNGQAGAFDTWKTDPHVLAQGTHQGTRRYFFGSGLVVKLFQLDHASLYAPNLAEHCNETAFLLNPPTGFNAPRLLLHGQHEREVWLVREQLPGELLIDMMRGGKPYDAKLILQDVLAQLAVLEAVGLYHNDVRAWNMLISPESRAKLIDYGSIVNDAKDCVWPRDIFLAFLIFVYEVTTGRVGDPNPLRTVAISPYRLDQPYRKWMMAFWSYPASLWSFKLMHQLLMQMNSLEEDGELAESRPLQHWMQAIEDAVEVQVSATRHVQWQQQQSEKHGEEMLSKLVDTQAHTQWLQNEWDAAQQKVATLSHQTGTLETELAIQREQSAQYEHKLAAAHEQVNALEAKTQWLQNEFDTSQQKVATLSHQTGTLETELAIQREQSAQYEHKLAAAHEQVNALEINTDLQQIELDAAKAKVDELNRSSHHWWAVADGLNQELQSVYASKSWQITLPLRKTMLSAKWLIKLPMRSIKYVSQQFSLSSRNNILRRILRSALLLTLTVVRAVPFIKQLVKKSIAHFPAVRSHLHAFARAHRSNQPKIAVAAFVQKSIQPPPSISSPHDEEVSKALLHALPKGQRIIYYYVDHTVGCPVNTGMQRLVRGLARSFMESGERLCFVKWDFDSRQLELVNRDELEHLARWQGPELTLDEVGRYPVSGSPGVAVSTHQMGEANWLLVPEVTHINNHPAAVTLDVIMAAKRLGLKSAFVFYDATPLRRKELADMAPKHEEYMQQLLLADLVVPISEFSASDLAAFFTHHELATSNTIPNIVALSLTGESQLSPRAIVASHKSRQLILTVGSITPHKNQLALVQAFEAFTHRHPKSGWELALVGNVHDDVSAELKAATNRTPSIKVLNNLSDEVLGQLYSECAFTVFPSVMEGFGLPILESLWHGKPCVCADFGAMAEVATGGGCLMVDVHSSDTILSAIERLVFEPDTLSRLQEETLARPLTSWRDYANDFSDELNRISDPLNQIGVIFYWIDHTCIYYANSGIQRVVRGLARALMELGVNLVPIKWNRKLQSFCPPTHDELVNMARWNGPPVNGWAAWKELNNASIYDWLLIPELLTDPAGPTGVTIKQQAAKYGMRTAWVFHDAIPWKMRDIYTQGQAESHSEYMRGLNEFELVLAISEFSRDDLIRFLRGLTDRTPNLEDRMRACVLPGEFKESTRVLQTRPTRTDAPIRILCVCTVEPRKNHLTLLEAYKQIVNKVDKKIELCLVGGAPFPELTEQVQRYIETVPGIRWERNADDARLRQLYDECDFTVYPSLEEGFGLPILESIWYARPCISRNSGAMAEVAQGGGCLMVETAEVQSLSDAMLHLVNDSSLLQRLASEAVARPFRTWNDYARDVVAMMASERQLPNRQKLPQILSAVEYKPEAINLSSQPLLSICISTYNRAAWLGLSLQNLERLIPSSLDEVEIVVCDNTSTDNTPEVVKPYMGRKDFRYYRNLRNVGMLGNLQVTAHHARGRHVWILGDDDLIKPGSIERILKVLREQPDLALVYLNYAYTREDDASAVTDLDRFLANSIPVAAPCPDISGPVWRVSTESENFFTAIYCLVFRRDHALQAYSQNTEGRPFSTMLTCIPTTYHVLHHMMNEDAYWIGEPLLVVNLNVSWMKYASIWILERLPEAFDIAEKMGADPVALDSCRVKHLPHISHWLNDIYLNQEEPNFECFSLPRLIVRFKHIQAFRDLVPRLMEIYAFARSNGAKGTDIPTEEIFAAFQ